MYLNKAGTQSGVLISEVSFGRGSTAVKLCFLFRHSSNGVIDAVFRTINTCITTARCMGTFLQTH